MSSITESVRRPRKSILSRPSSSTPCMSNWVTIRRESSRESFESLSGRYVHERRVADHDTGRVHRVLPAEPLERARGVDDLA